MKYLLLFLPMAAGLYPLAANVMKESYMTVMVNPPTSTVELLIYGNQCMDLSLKNQNFLGAIMSVPEPKPFQENWDVILLPFGSAQRSYCVFATVPVQWHFLISTYSDVANVGIRLEWDPFVAAY
ncbi:hypothetical protein [Chitinophaga sp. XS-30]|uniref:hypothetical protein n=1 Tax=Chitinophaga sp. XS-30 TaxID=2604421 RepID=UPI0011DDFEA8|nr:hypothetical protein [Chitinophaga sp. XS-30]QEH39580.1 hypothetical protein FW415_01320 [Chitinophaga sp. XS-30]